MPALRLAQCLSGVSYTVTAFESRAFRTCEEITSVSVPNTLTNWDTDRIFSTCTKLVDVNIPEGVTVMQMSTFNTCPSLGHITLPESLGNLSGAMFYSAHVKRLTIKNRNITFNGSNGYGDAFDVYSCVGTTASVVPVACASSASTIRRTILSSRWWMETMSTTRI